MLTNEEILKIAMEQSAQDCNCAKEDFFRAENVIVRSRIGEHARKYLHAPMPCNLVSYGNNIVASVEDEYRGIVAEYISRFRMYHCFETPNMCWLNDRMRPFRLSVCFMAEYFLPDVERLKALPCSYELRLLSQGDFTDLYLPEWGNALSESRKELDVLGVGAYDQGSLIALAGCSADCDTMWQIGVDVLPGYRKRGIASALTSRLALEILERGKVPFYCSAWSNIPSARNAFKSGFRPAWVEMTVKPMDVINRMNEP